MKKVFMLTTAVLLFSGATFANDHVKKSGKNKKATCAKGKNCCKKKTSTASL